MVQLSSNSSSLLSANRSRKARVALCMARPLDGEAYAALLEARCEVQVVLQSITTQGLSRRIAAEAIDVVLVEQKLVDRTGRRALEQLVANRVLRGVILLTEREANGGRTGAMKSQCARISPHGGSDQLVHLFRSLLGAPPNGAANGQTPAPGRLSATVTTRERQIWQLIGQGLSVRQIAEQLQIAESTVDSHKSRLMKKLDVHKSLDLVRLALRFGLVDV